MKMFRYEYLIFEIISEELKLLFPLFKRIINYYEKRIKIVINCPIDEFLSIKIKNSPTPLKK